RRAGEAAVGEREPDDRAGAEVAPQPRDVEQRLAARGVDVLVQRGQVRDGEAADLAGDLRAGDRVDDLARVDEPARRVEQLDALEEERALLRDEQREPLVDRDLSLVRLDLAEV